MRLLKKRMCLALVGAIALTLASSALAGDWGDHWGDEAASDTEQALTQITAELSARKAAVRCYSQSSWQAKLRAMGFKGTQQGPVGFADVVSGEVELAPFVCGPLESFRTATRKPRIWCYAGPDRYGQRYPCDEMPQEYGGRCQIEGHAQVCKTLTADLALAALGLAHEAAHLKGISTEADAQCYAVQTVARVVNRLGARWPYAKDVAQIAFQQLSYFPKAYRLPRGCRDGGPLDLHPARRGWPTP